MRCWIITCLVLPLVCHNSTSNTSPNQSKKQVPGQGKNQDSCEDEDPNSKDGYKCCKKFRNNKERAMDTKWCMNTIDSVLQTGKRSDAIDAMKTLEQVLEETEVAEPTEMITKHLMAFLHRPIGHFRGVEIQATENQVTLDQAVRNSKVRVQLPRELDVGANSTIVFCMLTWRESNETMWEDSDKLYENRLVGLSVRGKNISGLQEHVNITMSLSVGINETQEPRCVFLNFSTQEYSVNGCLTVWEPGQSHITCSCDHLTYFGVLMVTAQLSSTDQQILMYISMIGCSFSLVALVLTVLLFIMSRKVRADISMRVHINLTIALILLNVHFLPSHTVATLSSSGICLYAALALHYSLLATFSWMAIEGFHLYLFLVRVFNIYIRKYLLKLSVVGWGIPAVIVALVVIIDRDSYGLVHLDSVYSNSTAICYISNNTVKMVTTVGMFSLVFAFNVTMLAVTVRRVVSLPPSRTRDRDRAKRGICTVLGITTLLGITWGLIFFSFGYLSTAALYPFCILNSLQGVFIFLWFVLSLRKNGNSGATMSSETRNTNS